MNEVILVINSGSSSIKVSVFSATETLNLLYHGNIDNIDEDSLLTIFDEKNDVVLTQSIPAKDHEAGLNALLEWIKQFGSALSLKAVGHRVVHGGTFFKGPTRITDTTLEKMEQLIPLAPLHQPHNLEAIRIIQQFNPKLTQIACFDTTWHRTQDRLSTLFAIPDTLTQEGIIRYGFHGLSYEYIASVLNKEIGKIGDQRVIVAHLGNGASLCAMYQKQSVATSMGLTGLDGLVMGTRCGRIDPGVLLYLLQQKKYSPSQIEQLLYKESGLLGVSGISHDVRTLLASKMPKAVLAIDLFCYRAALEIGSMLAALQGCDALIFTGGIGENASLIRHKICAQLDWLGLRVDQQANNSHATIFSKKDSAILLARIPTDEERIIAKHTLRKTIRDGFVALIR